MEGDEFKNLGETDARLLFLEAVLLHQQASLDSLRHILFEYLEEQGAKSSDNAGNYSTIAEYNIELMKRNLRDLLSHLADGDANRASKIARILEYAFPKDSH